MHRFTHLPYIVINTLLLLLAINFCAHAESEIEHEVEDLPYGLSLYHFYQGKYFSAITDLLVARHYGTISSYDKNSELLLGGLYLSYGLQHKSSAVFSKIITEEDAVETEIELARKKEALKKETFKSPWTDWKPKKRVKTPQHVRDRAWFHLGKNHYQNGFIEEAETALSTVKNTLSDEYEAERLYILSNIYSRTGQLSKAVEILEEMSNDTVWVDYATFNIGAALIRNNQLEDGKDLLLDLSNTTSLNRERVILQDKARLALAYTALKSNEPKLAAEYFEAIRLKDTESTRALLGTGWAWYQQGEFDKSLTPWMELANREKSDSAVQEALISIPNSFEKINNHNQALLQYDLAIKTYQEQIGEVKKVLDSIDNGEFIKKLKLSSLGKESATPFSILFNINASSNQYLLPLITSNEFHDALKTYQETTYLSYTLNHWLQGLPALDLILREKIKRYNSKLTDTVQNPKIKLAKTLHKRRDALARSLNSITSKEDELKLATFEEQQKLKKLNKARTVIDKNKDEYEEEDEKQKLLYGLLFWDIATDYKSRQWQAEKRLKELDKSLAEMNSSLRSLNNAWNTAPAMFKKLSSQIKNKLPRTKKLIGKMTASLKQQEKQLEKMALKVINQQYKRLEFYYDRAMFSRARIYDSLIVKD